MTLNMNAMTESMLDSLLASVRQLEGEARRFNDICRPTSPRLPSPDSGTDSGAIEALSAEISGIRAEADSLRREAVRLAAEADSQKTEAGRLRSLLDEAAASHESETASLRAEIAAKESELAATARAAAEKVAVIEAENRRLQETAANASAVSCRELKEIYTGAARRLAEAAACEFIEECDPGAPADVTDSMHNRIRNSVGSLCAAVGALDCDTTTVATLADSFRSLVASRITDRPLADIARWYAYAQLPFMLDTDREEGRRVIAPEITRLYNALASLLALAGFAYQLPRLFVENVYEGDYENVAGTEQMNLDYQCPNVMTHVARIDRADNREPIVDIVETGYYDRGKLVRKSKVIA